MLIHGIYERGRFDIGEGDTLLRPLHLDKAGGFPIIVANPPFSLRWSASAVMAQDVRFAGYTLPPPGRADLAFVLHILHHLAADGVAAVVLPHGVLFRQGREESIRRQLIKKNVIDALISLPADIFFGTSIPTCVLILKKGRPTNAPLLFIEASREYEKKKGKRGKGNYLSADNVAKIVKTYQEGRELERYSRYVSLDEIKSNEFNLNFPRYIDTNEEQDEDIDLRQLWQEIQEAKARANALDEEIERELRNLGIL